MDYGLRWTSLSGGQRGVKKLSLTPCWALWVSQKTARGPQLRSGEESRLFVHTIAGDPPTHPLVRGGGVESGKGPIMVQKRRLTWIWRNKIGASQSKTEGWPRENLGTPKHEGKKKQGIPKQHSRHLEINMKWDQLELRQNHKTFKFTWTQEHRAQLQCPNATPPTHRKHSLTYPCYRQARKNSSLEQHDSLVAQRGDPAHGHASKRTQHERRARVDIPRPTQLALDSKRIKWSIRQSQDLSTKAEFPFVAITSIWLTLVTQMEQGWKEQIIKSWSF